MARPSDVLEDYRAVRSAELPPPPSPTLAQYGSSLMVTYPPGPSCSGITLEFSRAADHRETLTADVTISSLGAGEIAWDRINLLAARTRHALAKMAEERSPEAPWREVVDTACRLVIKRLRTDDPPVPLRPQEPSQETKCLVPGLIFRNEVNLLFADGGSTKSLLALALAMSGIRQWPLSRVWTVAPVQKALYLDWESTQGAHAERLWGLSSFMEAPPDGSILYQRMTRPFTDQAEAVRRERDRQAVDLVICDSLGPASGLEPESGDAAIRTLQALRSLDTTVVCLAHISKAAADGMGQARPYGSVFVTNLARSTIFMRPDERREDGRLTVNLIHQKVNDGRRMLPSALEWVFEPSGLIRCGDARVSTEFISLDKRIEAELTGGPESATSLADKLGVPENTLRATLSRMKSATRVLRLDDFRGGRGQKSLWALVDRKRNTE